MLTQYVLVLSTRSSPQILITPSVTISDTADLSQIILTRSITTPTTSAPTEVTLPHNIITTSTSTPSKIMVTENTKAPATGSTSQYALTQNITMFVPSTTSETSTETGSNTAPFYNTVFMDTMACVSTVKPTTRKYISNDAYFSCIGGTTVVILPFTLLSLFYSRQTSDFELACMKLSVKVLNLIWFC